MDATTFDQELLGAYRGERAAAVTLEYLIEHRLLGEEKQLAELFLSVEVMVGDQLEPLVRRRGLPIHLDEDRVRQAEARARRLENWQGVVASLGAALDGHLSGFKALRNASEPGDHAVFDLLVSHEMALARFGDLLRAGRTDEAKLTLRAVGEDFGLIAQKMRPKEAG